MTNKMQILRTEDIPTCFSYCL